MRLEGKVALITGTASGIGRATALRFATEGARIVAVDIVAANHETVELIRAAGGEVTAVDADVSDDADVALAVETAEATYGRPRCRLQQCWDHAGRRLRLHRHFRGDHRQDPGREPQGRAVRMPASDPRYAPGGRRLDHQHSVLRGVGGRGHPANRLHRLQGGGAVDDPGSWR